MSFFLLIFHTYTYPHIHIHCLTIEKKPTISNMYVGVYMCEKLTKIKMTFMLSTQQQQLRNRILIRDRDSTNQKARDIGGQRVSFVYKREFVCCSSPLFFPIATLSKKNSATNYSACGTYSAREDVPIEKIVRLCHQIVDWAKIRSRGADGCILIHYLFYV